MKDPIVDLWICDRECPSCGWRHQLDAFKPRTDRQLLNFQKTKTKGDRVRVLANRRNEGRYPFDERFVGEEGVVVAWDAYCGPVYVRVEFSDGVRANFDPCELEHV